MTDGYIVTWVSYPSIVKNIIMYFSRPCLSPTVQPFSTCSLLVMTVLNHHSPHSHRSFVNKKKGFNIKFVTQLAQTPSGVFFPLQVAKIKGFPSHQVPHFLSLLCIYAAVFICHVVLTDRKVFCQQAGCMKVAHDIDMKASVASLATTTISRFRISNSSGSLGIINNSKFILRSCLVASVNFLK